MAPSCRRRGTFINNVEISVDHPTFSYTQGGSQASSRNNLEIHMWPDIQGGLEGEGKQLCGLNPTKGDVASLPASGH